MLSIYVCNITYVYEQIIYNTCDFHHSLFIFLIINSTEVIKTIARVQKTFCLSVSLLMTDFILIITIDEKKCT